MLDVSRSMNGLINQAKGQFWRMINALSSARKKGRPVSLEIALGSFGNQGLKDQGHIKLHTGLTSDMDSVSEQLFQLNTSGGNEYCGYALQQALDSLEWSDSRHDLKIIFIAGNESFNQGEVDYIKACMQARKQRVIVNSIYCGPLEEGEKLLWADGADKGKGRYLNIMQDSAEGLDESIWDSKIIEYNKQINSTYLPYGRQAKKLVKRQKLQDQNAMMLGNAYLRERVIYKLSETYQNPHWDLVDAYRQDSLVLNKIPDKDLPEDMRKMSRRQRERYLQVKLMMRQDYKAGAGIYIRKAEDYLAQNRPDSTTSPGLDERLTHTIKEQGEALGFNFD